MEGVQVGEGALVDLRSNAFTIKIAPTLTATEECEIALRKYLKCKVRVVRESCEVALDMCEYECDGVFQYADGLNATAPK